MVIGVDCKWIEVEVKGEYTGGRQGTGIYLLLRENVGG